eukprot:NODE_36_length_36011_cov_1.012920.p16 type:complete len:223 gc:universal NODE_36_length_36011_cov_1.012920:24060-24728(+)
MNYYSVFLLKMLSEFSCQVASRLPTLFGDVYLHYYDSHHLAITKHYKSLSLLRNYELSQDETILPPNYKFKNGITKNIPRVRIHSSCFTGEVLGSLRCDCGEQLVQAVEDCELVIYLHQEGRNIGLLNKLRAYNLQDKGHDTVSANVALELPIDSREYKMAASMLEDLGIKRIKLMTNNPEKINQIERNGIEVERIPSVVHNSHPEMERYLETKKLKMSHLL